MISPHCVRATLRDCCQRHSCVTNLLAIGQETLLQRLFQEVVVPEPVWRELCAEHDRLPPFLRVVKLRDNSAIAQLAPSLDEGEAAAILLAQELHADYLLMDETAGRAEAIQRGLRVLGLLGVLQRAKECGMIARIKPLLVALREDAGFWLSPDLVERVLRESDEA